MLDLCSVSEDAGETFRALGACNVENARYSASLAVQGCFRWATAVPSYASPDEPVPETVHCNPFGSSIPSTRRRGGLHLQIHQQEQRGLHAPRLGLAERAPRVPGGSAHRLNGVSELRVAMARPRPTAVASSTVGSMRVSPRYDGPPIISIAGEPDDQLAPVLRQRRRLAAMLADLRDDDWSSPSR